MQKLMRAALLIVLVLFILIPVVIYSRLSSKDERYTQAINNYECVRDNCSADFDGDGRTGNLLIDRMSPPPSGSYSARQAWLVVNDSHRELLRLPFSYADSTLRTHVAIRNEIGGAHLLIFDHTIEGKPIRQVFAWNGKQMTQVQPSAADQEILAALGARDDAGSWNHLGPLQVPNVTYFGGLLRLTCWHRGFVAHSPPSKKDPEYQQQGSLSLEVIIPNPSIATRTCRMTR